MFDIPITKSLATRTACYAPPHLSFPAFDTVIPNASEAVRVLVSLDHARRFLGLEGSKVSPG